MELTATRLAPATWPRRLAARIDAPALSAWTLAFALVVYLAMRDGGYDTIVRSDVGVAVWWIVLLAALAGFLPARIGTAGWVAIGLLGGFAAWTGLEISWSQSAEQSVVELGREAAYLGFLVLAIALQGRTAARATINGLACAIGLVTVLSVLSRLHPQAFPANAQLAFLGTTAVRRLSYPLNYWNALAAFVAMGVPLMLAVSIGGRTILGKALAAATLPVCTLCLYLTVSRGGVLELAVGLAVFLLLVPRRLEAVATIAIAGTGGAILVWGASRRVAIRSGLETPAAIHQGSHLLTIAIFVCAGVALLRAALALAERYYDRPAILRVSPRATVASALTVAVIVLIVAIAAGAPGKIEHQWTNFTQPPGVVVPTSESTVFSRLSAINGNGRYQFWIAALHANATNPLLGIGPGTFRFWWAAHATTDGPVLNAHSLYFETLAETGIIGLVLIAGLLLWLMGVAVRRSLREPAPLRLWIAAAAAGLAVFMAAAALEWVWQMAAIVAAALLMGAVIVAGRGEPTVEDPPPRRRWTGPAQRAVLAVTAIIAICAVAVPLAGAIAIRQSQQAAIDGNLNLAYRYSLDAQRVQPYAATPRLQEAVVLEADGELRAAAQDAQAATQNEPTNWQTWLTLARIDAERGAERQAIVAMRQAMKLNPRSTLFQNP
ncbi:MAG: O-antigen ligase family protein [Solirubrobacteraceae bacterium]